MEIITYISTARHMTSYLKTASAVSTLKDACSGLGMAHSSDRERAQGNAEPYLEEIKYSPGPSYVLK